MVGLPPLLPPLPPPPPHPAARTIESRIKHHPNGRRLLCEVLDCIANGLECQASEVFIGVSRPFSLNQLGLKRRDW